MVEPTGRAVTLPATVVFPLEDGQIVRRRAQADALGMLRRVGATAEPGVRTSS